MIFTIFKQIKYSNVVLNQAPMDVSKKNYKNKITPKTKLLLGQKYAIIDSTYLSVRKNLKPREGEINRILVFYGGIDKTNETTKALNAIKKLDLSEIFIGILKEFNFSFYLMLSIALSIALYGCFESRYMGPQKNYEAFLRNNYVGIFVFIGFISQLH